MEITIWGFETQGEVHLRQNYLKREVSNSFQAFLKRISKLLRLSVSTAAPESRLGHSHENP